MNGTVNLDNELIVFLSFKLIILVTCLYLIYHLLVLVIRSVNIDEPVVQRRTRRSFAIVNCGL